MEGVDSLDHFMVSLGTSIDKATKTKFRRVIVELKKVLEKFLSFQPFCLLIFLNEHLSYRILLFYVILIDIFWLLIRKGKDFLNS